MQDDDLFTGSLLENIAIDESHRDMNQVEYAARMACIHDEIVKMPVGYLTKVGHMGSSLSGGQRQRLMIARYIYVRRCYCWMRQPHTSMPKYSMKCLRIRFRLVQRSSQLAMMIAFLTMRIVEFYFVDSSSAALLKAWCPGPLRNSGWTCGRPLAGAR